MACMAYGGSGMNLCCIYFTIFIGGNQIFDNFAHVGGPSIGQGFVSWVLGFEIKSLRFRV